MYRRSAPERKTVRELFALAGAALAAAVAMLGFSLPSGSVAAEPRFELTAIRGRVVWASEALAKRLQIEEVPEASQRVLTLVEPDGTIHPLVEDVRGRAFRRDERLRNIDVELLVRKFPKSPFVQVVQVFEWRRDGKYELDYWCEICSIAMFELKECECCQAAIELRRRKVASALK